MTLPQFKTVGYADLSSSGRSIRVRIHGKPDLYINAYFWIGTAFQNALVVPAKQEVNKCQN